LRCPACDERYRLISHFWWFCAAAHRSGILENEEAFSGKARIDPHHRDPDAPGMRKFFPGSLLLLVVLALVPGAVVATADPAQ
jgi:hypothetical protein